MNKGYVKISIVGKNPDFFLKRYCINNFNFWDYEKLNYNKITIKLSFDDYLSLINKKSIYDIQIIKYYGFIKYVNYVRNNYLFLIFFAMSIVFFIFVSNLCLDIEVVHNDKNIRKSVMENLNDNGIKKLHIIPNYDKRKKIIEKIIHKNKNKIEWLDIERKGSKLIVKVTERRINKKQKKLKPRHVVAKKRGIIKKIEAQNGVVLKKINDYVEKGDIIISGDIIKDETVKNKIVANGTIYAETWYKVKVEYPLYYKEIRYLNEVKNNIIITFLNKRIYVRKNYINSYLEKKKVLIYDKIFPFNISLEKQRKTKTIKQVLTYDEALKKADLLAEKKILSRLSKDEYIISKKNLNFNGYGSKIVVDVFFKVYENITDYLDVDLNLIKISPTLD